MKFEKVEKYLKQYTKDNNAEIDKINEVINNFSMETHKILRNQKG